MPTYGLQWSEIYGRIQDYANINNVVGSATKAKKAGNDAIRLISSLRNWESLKRESSITPVASTQTYAILTGTTDFDHIISCWYVYSGIDIPIDVVDDDKWNKESVSNIDGTPTICRITKANGTLSIQFSPRPSSSFIQQSSTINFDYIKKPTEMSSDTDIPDIPNSSQQMAIVYLAVADLLAKQGDITGMDAWEKKANKLLNQAHKIDDKKEGRSARIGRPIVAINTSGIKYMDYK